MDDSFSIQSVFNSTVACVIPKPGAVQPGEGSYDETNLGRMMTAH